MQRFRQIVFTTALVALSWWAMMAVHELGHVIGALASGGSVARVVLDPFTISRTDVSPNPHPAVVVWFGPVVGCALPVAALAIIPRGLAVLRIVARFFAGFCLVANGAYISLGFFHEVGDCGEMLRTGTPHWAMFAFGFAAVSLGLWLWHGLGSLADFVDDPSLVTRRMVYVVVGVLLIATLAGAVLFPR